MVLPHLRMGAQTCPVLVRVLHLLGSQLAVLPPV